MSELRNDVGRSAINAVHRLRLLLACADERCQKQAEAHFLSIDESLTMLANSEAFHIEACAAHQKHIDELTDSIVNLKADMGPKLHRRKCWQCQTVHWHVDAKTPWVLCPACGSQDTRRVER